MAVGLVMSGLGPNVIIVSRWFRKHRGKVVGMVVASSSLGGATMPLLISPIVNDLGWRWGFGLLSVLFWLFAVIPVYKIIQPDPESMELNPDGEKSSDEIIIEAKDTIPLKHALLSRALWCLGIGSACLWFSIQGLNSQNSIFFEQEAAFTAQQTEFLISILYCFTFGVFSLLSYVFN